MGAGAGSAARGRCAAVSSRKRLVVRADAASKPVLCIGEALWDGLPLVRASPSPSSSKPQIGRAHV